MNLFPLIGVSGSVDEKETQSYLMRCYSGALIAAGAAPLLLSPDAQGEILDALLDRLDGVFLAGGVDLAPELFGEEPIEKLGEVNPLRDAFEIQLVKKAFEQDMPVLGVCRGVQSMNVALGGTLWQDLPSQYRTQENQPPMLHRQTSRDCYTSHRVQIERDSLLYRLVGADEIPVNSFHHQAVKAAAPSLRVVARASDGVIEAVECPERAFFLGVQWHPERYFDRREDAMAIFRAFSEAAARYAEHK